MSVGSPFTTLLKANFRAWIGAKGFWLVVAGALLPMLLTGAWVAAHQADLVLTDLRVEPAEPTDGDPVRFVATIENRGDRAVGPFNTTLTLHTSLGNDSIDLRPVAGGVATATVPTLAPGAKHELTLEWNATPGAYAAIAQADSQLIFGQLFADVTDEIAEKDEYNNNKVDSFRVFSKVPTAQPTRPSNATLTGNANATNTTSLRIESISRPATITEGENATFTVVVRNDGAEAVENATVRTRINREATGPLGRNLIPATEQPRVVSIPAGESTTVEVVWTTRAGGFWHEAWVTPPPGAGDANAGDNYRAESFKIDAEPKDLAFTPEPKGTIKVFYFNILRDLHLSLLIPLIALFYAAGVIADEKDRGSLAYTLTRPVPRWAIPITKFIASFLVAAVALLVGVVLTYLFLFGTTVEGRDIGYLTTPLLMAIVTLFAYGAVFILLGTLVERPYLVGLAFVLGWEFAAFQFVPWTHNLTLTFHVRNALSSWSLTDGVQWLPTEPRALIVILAIGIGALVLAAAQMRRREFQV